MLLLFRIFIYYFICVMLSVNMFTVGPFDTPKQSRSVISTLEADKEYRIKYKGDVLPLKLVSADGNVQSDINNLETPSIIAVTSDICNDSTSYLLHFKKMSKENI